ncbi:sensor histidine kinase [Flavobacterium algicola]|uniref:sensor histidine kinase n=1 Tax=Flavobacterium algicola TaxID=556529 RepID=UPI001EFDCFDD|nr:HAMP domain-containing sensor histidine kinase [Flavobacterium algicola]MCG9794060.1 HAMP domain-containing histidine kinase [Flavobacterium algicola]
MKKKYISIYKNIKETESKHLIITILFSCAMLIVTNYYTLKTLSATRAYISGESHYSKGHNKAVRNLITYLFTTEEEYWQLFKKHLSVPQGDETARLAMQNGKDITIIKKGFLAGENSEDDLNDMIWLFQNFQSLPFLKKSIGEWENGDRLNRELYQLGLEIHQQIDNNESYNSEKILTDIHAISNEISINQDSFSQSLGDGTRQTKKYLFFINGLLIMFIIGSISLYYNGTIKKILISKQKLSIQKKHLQNIINDLEKTKESLSTEIIQHKKIIGTISHDIRSPLKYIQLIAKHLSSETKKKEDPILHKYATSIHKSSSQLYQFTKTLIQYSKIYIEDKQYVQKSYSVHNLIENKKTFFEYIARNNDVEIINTTDENLISKVNIRILSIIIHNLLDNAIKNTHNGTVKIGAEANEGKIIFCIKDTGIGMNQDIIDYYTNLFNNRDPEKLILSTYGIGLHLVLELLVIIRGEISFSSKKNEGTTVMIKLNHIH